MYISRALEFNRPSVQSLEILIIRKKKIIDAMVVVWQYILITDEIFSSAMVFEFMKENIRCHRMLRHCILNFVVHEISLFIVVLLMYAVICLYSVFPMLSMVINEVRRGVLSLESNTSYLHLCRYLLLHD
jgi:hypothetical protein